MSLKDRHFVFKKPRIPSFKTLDTVAIIGFYFHRHLSNTARIIIRRYLYDRSNFKEIAKMLNDMQRTRAYNESRVEEIYHRNIQKLDDKLRKAGMLTLP